MTEKINWQKELLESGKFNDKFPKNLLEHGAKIFMQGIYPVSYTHLTLPTNREV